MGVCLGHQAISLAFGGSVSYAKEVKHGKVSDIEHDGLGTFKGFSREKLDVVRYHSIVVDSESLPSDLKVTCKAKDDNHIMGLRHGVYSIETFQFHPESYESKNGKNFFKNFISEYC